MTLPRFVARAVIAGTCFACVPGCEKRAEPPPARAAFGVRFGGEIQEREEIPLVIDQTRQAIGIRVEFRDPPSSALRVNWELEKPPAGKDAGVGLVDYGEARARPGEPRLDIPLAFRPGDRPGAWRVRVSVDGRALLDRPFRVVSPSPERPSED